MRRFLAVSALLAATGLLAAPTPAHADPADDVVATTGSARVRFAAREWLDVGLDVGGVRLDRLKLHPPGRLRGLFARHAEANRARAVLTNRTDRNVNPAVAVAVFDREGRLLGAANSGARLSTLRSGETEELDLHFGGVFRHLEDGDYIYLSVEY